MTPSSSPAPLRNGESRGAGPQQGRAGKKAGAGTAVLLLVLRVAALGCSAAAAALAATDGGALRRAPFRLLLAADAIVAAYSAFEAGAAAFEAARGATLLPEALQLWFDFGHDQGFGYMALAAAVAAARDAATCGGGQGWRTTGGGVATCVQVDIAVGLGFAAFALLAAAALVTGFRVACFLATGSRSRPPPSPYY